MQCGDGQVWRGCDPNAKGCRNQFSSSSSLLPSWGLPHFFASLPHPPRGEIRSAPLSSLPLLQLQAASRTNKTGQCWQVRALWQHTCKPSGLVAGFPPPPPAAATCSSCPCCRQGGETSPVLLPGTLCCSLGSSGGRPGSGHGIERLCSPSRSGSPPNGLARCGSSAAQRRDWRRLRAPAAAAPAPLRLPSSRSPAARTAAAAAAGMRHDPTPGFSMLLFGVSLACYSPSLKSVQDQAYTAPVVLEGKVQALPPPPGSGNSNSTREPPASAGGILVKVLDLWPRNSGGLQREQLISVGNVGSPAPCFKVKRNHRYIFFLEPTEKPLVFKTAFAPLDTSGKSLKKDVSRILCADCAVPPKLKKLKSPNVHVGEKISLKCEATAGNPQPSYKWYKDGKELKKSKDIRIKYGNGKKISRLQFNKVKLEDAGEYSCEAENVLGKDTAKGSLNVRSVTTTLSSWSGHARKCNETAKSYCVNGGVCYYIEGINQLSCKCPIEFTGDRCEHFAMISFSKHLGFELKEAEELYQKRVLTITGICVALLVVGIVCVVAYCKTKKQRKQMHNHLRQNMCPAHQNRNLANGPSHPQLDPEEIQMADYISKNISATEHVIQRETETTFSGSHSCSPSHHCSTATPTSSQRQESHTWSLERTESLTSDSQSGMMLSSVGTSKCNSPACVEARARRGAAYCLEDSRRPTMQYRDSVDSLRDSPHSERYVSALTTPARLSPVDFHYSLAAQVPTFEITSPNSAHAVSLPPAAPISFRVEEQQPLLRRYQVPFQDMQRYDSYYQRKSYLNESMGSLPSSPFRITEDDEYETTQEYITALEQPKKTASNNRRWKRSKLNGQVSHRARTVRDSFSGSSASYSESDEEELMAESTPFLSIQNTEAMNTDSPPLYRPGDSRTYYSFKRHSAPGESGQSRLTHTRPKQDSAPL